MNTSRWNRPAVAGTLIATTLLAGAGITSHTASAATSFTLLQKDGHLTFVDTAPKGGEDKPPSQGDMYVVSNTLLDPATKQKVGRLHLVCTTTVGGKHAVAVCDSVFSLPQGSITGQATFPLSKARATTAITGGTGAYAGASGTASWDGTGGGALSSYTITLN